MIIGAAISDDSVDIGSDKLMLYEASDTRQSHNSSRLAPNRAQAGTVSRWLDVCMIPRARCGTATPMNAIGPHQAVTPPASSEVASTIPKRVRRIFTPSARA